jgi:hypothetical protein
VLLPLLDVLLLLVKGKRSPSDAGTSVPQALAVMPAVRHVAKPAWEHNVNRHQSACLLLTR